MYDRFNLAQLATGSTALGIKGTKVRQLRIVLPPLEEQFAIAHISWTARPPRLDELIAEATHAIDLLQERRTALISAAVTGKIDVRGLAKERCRMSLNLHKEIRFEDEVCEYLAAHGWLYAEVDAAHYDRALALFPPDVLAWVQQAQPKAWEALTKNHGAQAGDDAAGAAARTD